METVIAAGIADIQWDQVGVGIGALLTLIFVVRLMRTQTDKLLRHTEETTDKVLTFFGNHMSENVKQQGETAGALRELTFAVRELKDESRQARRESELRSE